MRYIDNGPGQPQNESLFSWLSRVLTPEVVGIRWQSGFFEARVLGVFAPTLRSLANDGHDTIILIGSNDGETQSDAVHQLVDLVGLPRPNACLGVVGYTNGFYHPKTIHLCYPNGREAAYVGSANLTPSGINGLNIEAGIVLDTDESDPVELLSQVKQAPLEWFISRPEGLFEVQSHDDVSRLVSIGVLTPDRADRRPDDHGAERSHDPFPRRGDSHELPRNPDLGAQDNDDDDVTQGKVGFDEDVLIAQLTGPGRWGQSAFPEWFIDNFFGVRPNTGDILRLWPVTQDDGVGAVEEIACGFKQGSRNWYYELGLAIAMGAYPQIGKPIGVFHRVGNQACRYTILMPGNEAYPLVANFLAENVGRIVRPRTELERTVVPAVELREAWPDSWFF